MAAGSLDLDRYKLIRSEKNNKTKFLVGILFGTLFISMVFSGYAQGEYKQLIHISLFFKTKEELVTNVEFYFNHVPSPVNLSLPEFDHLNWAQYSTKRWLNQKMFISLTLQYSKETNALKAYQAAQEFLRVFNHSSLQLLSTMNKTTEFIYTFGYLKENLENMKNFLRFRPQTGFGSIVDKFLQLYIPGKNNKGMYAYYTLSKNKQGYFWQLAIKASGPESIQFGNLKTIELKQILNSEEPIVASDRSAIIIRVTENETISNKLYTMRVKSIFPLPNRTEVDTVNQKRKYVWELDEYQQLDNIKLDIELDVISDDNNSDLPVGPLMAVGIIVVLIIGVVSIKHIHILPRFHKKQRLR